MTREVLVTERFSISIDIEEAVGRIEIKDLYSGISLADGPYRYAVALDDGESVTYFDGLHAPEVHRKETREETVLTIRGRAGNSSTQNSPITITHEFRLPAGEEYFEERVTIANYTPRKYILRGYGFSFRKLLEFNPKDGTWEDGMGGYRMIAVPYRVQPDGKRHDYNMEDVYFGRYLSSESENPMVLRYDLVDRGRGRSEGWAWTDGEYGLLSIKYNPDLIEYSMLETERVGDQVFLNFGGAGPSLYNEPREARHLTPNKVVSFGYTRFVFYEGLWRRGYSIFKEFMTFRGHSLPESYDPPLTWNELFDVGWHHADRDKLKTRYTKDTIKREAEKARDLGCGLLYLGPGWETAEGATTWDEERLGDIRQFAKEIKLEYGLDIGFRTVGRSHSNAYPGKYRKNPDGSLGYYRAHQANPYYEPCMDYRDFLEEKARRILKVAEAGMKFVTFDEFDWRGACFDANHGHPVPTTPSQHSKSVISLVQMLKERLPEIIVEAHDPIWPWGVRYLPVYFLHRLAGSFDETWAFELSWDPLDDLLSGRALALFYHNLAYDVPLYNHISMAADNDNCLAFWWNASTVRHLGIGGKAGNDARYQAYKKAIADYLSLRDLYTQGVFYGYDEYTHIHFLPEAGRAVLNAFNITEETVTREVELNVNELGLLGEVKVEGARYRSAGAKTVVYLTMPPMSPLLVRFSA